MREIKFKCWNIDKKEWVLGSPLALEVISFCDNPFKCVNIPAEQQGLIFLQYTGLTDKNNVEIYEGDIVKRYKKTTAPACAYEVKFGDYLVDGLDYYSNYTTAGFYLESPFCENGDTTYIKPNETIVIGNIYEHKNLLEEVNP